MAVSKTQAVALRSVLADRHDLEPDDKANIVLLISKLSWQTPAHGQFAMGTLADAPIPRQRRSQQAAKHQQTFSVSFIASLPCQLSALTAPGFCFITETCDDGFVEFCVLVFRIGLHCRVFLRVRCGLSCVILSSRRPKSWTYYCNSQ